MFKDEVLENERRRKIYAVIEASPSLWTDYCWSCGVVCVRATVVGGSVFGSKHGLAMFLRVRLCFLGFVSGLGFWSKKVGGWFLLIWVSFAGVSAVVLFIEPSDVGLIVRIAE